MRSQALRGSVTDDQARAALETWARLGLRRFGAAGLLDRVWELRGSLTAHDATYVALAEALDCELLTADGRPAGATGPRCPLVVVRH